MTAAIGAEGIFSKPGAAVGPAGFGMRRKFWGERIAPRQLSRRAGDGSALSVVVRREAPDVVSTQSARGRASYRCPIVGAAPSPRSAPDVVSTQSARGRASYRCPIVGAAPPPRSAPDVVLTQSARGRVSYRCPAMRECGRRLRPRYRHGGAPIGRRQAPIRSRSCVERMGAHCITPRKGMQRPQALL